MCNGDSHKFDDKVPDQFVVISHEYLFQMHKHEYIVYDKATKVAYLYLIDDKYSTDALLLPILDSNENVMVYTGE